MNNKSVGITLVVIAATFLLQLGIRKYIDRYPSGPTVNITEVYLDEENNTFYKAEPYEYFNLFTGIIVYYGETGDLKVKAGVKDGLFHGPYNAWYDSGQEQISLIFKEGTKYKNFKAYYSNGKQVEGKSNEIAEKIFSGQIVLE
tara:strand:+ start:1153 stop:1584 length:432 start_codon:yes stop_codon:yes gene_type:complete